MIPFKLIFEVQTKTRKRTKRSTSLRSENNKAKKEKRDTQRNKMMVTVASNNFSTESAIKNGRERLKDSFKKHRNDNN